MANNQPAPLALDLQEFLIDRQANNVTPKTIQWYRYSLDIWQTFVNDQGITSTEAVDARLLRRFLLFLKDRGHNPGGVNHIYGAVRAFLRWYETEYAPEDWQNPTARVKPPRRPKERLEPLSLDEFQQLIDACKPRTFHGDRDRAFLYLLLDTGLRHQEAASLTVGDVDLQTGQILVKRGKGQKARVVFIGAKTRRTLLAYYRHRETLNDGDPLWVTSTGKALSKSGLRQIVRRCAQRAGIPEPGMHSFRRAFAVNSLRNGMDVVTLQRLLGHADLSVIDRYLALIDDDLRDAHRQHGVVDHMT